jgi:hypothetical protein
LADEGQIAQRFRLYLHPFFSQRTALFGNYQIELDFFLRESTV